MNNIRELTMIERFRFLKKYEFLRKTVNRFRRAQLLQFDPHLLENFDEKNITVLSETFFYDRESLKKLIRFIPEKKKMVEVGSLVGFSTRLFSLYFDYVISIDPYCFDYDDGDKNSYKHRLSIARDLFEIRFFDDPHVLQIRETSEEASNRFEDNELDFVYLDAGHNYKAVKKDIVLWKAKVKDGSYIAGDDYGWAGVTKAVKEEFKEYEVIDGRWLAKKD